MVVAFLEAFGIGEIIQLKQSRPLTKIETLRRKSGGLDLRNHALSLAAQWAVPETGHLTVIDCFPGASRCGSLLRADSASRCNGYKC